MGQNFLVDPDVLQKIASAINPLPGDSIIEIGPGLGFLTRLLSQNHINLTAVELDRDCVAKLNNLHLANTSIIHGDFLKFDLPQLQSSNKIKIVGNIPYQITAPIMKHLLGEIGTPSPWFPHIEYIVLTIQHEVAKRLVASPGTKDYSQITLLTNFYCTPSILYVVPSNCFYPEPEVTSATVKLVPLKQPAVSCSNYKLLRQIIAAGFSQRRKMLKNNLDFLISEKQLLAVFNKLNFDPQTRAERLSLSHFAKLTDAINNELSTQ